MVVPIRSVAAFVFQLVRGLDEGLGRGGIANAAAAVEHNEHRNLLVAAARSRATEGLPLPTSA